MEQTQETKQTEQKKLITKEMTVGDVVEKYPHLTEVLTSYGLHCVGCHAATWETLEQGTMGHGMSEGTLNEMVEELNAKALQKPQVDEDIVLTAKAVEKVHELREAEGKPQAALRVAVLPGGCSGMSYDLAFDDDAPDVDDVVKDYDGLKVYIDKESLTHMKGTKIDFVDGLQGSGFKIDNPQAKSTCGCGDSFS